MAAISNALVSTNGGRKTTSVGPFKLEFIWCDGVADAGASTGTVTTDMIRPIAACAGQFSSHTDVGIYTAITGNTITVTAPGTEQTALLVFGF